MTTAKEIVDALIVHKNVLIYGPPGTGKSHLMNEVARAFAALDGANQSGISIDTSSEQVPFIQGHPRHPIARWVTFHQSYSYEDFVIGLRPVPSPNSGFSLVPKPGVLLELCAEAFTEPALLMVDEINRGNASKIFGEFITLMEPSKRLLTDGSSKDTTVTIRLPYLEAGENLEVKTQNGQVQIGRDFRMPSDLYLLASMNSVDKSTAPLDAALRRRFHIISLFPTEDAVRQSLGLATIDGLHYPSSFETRDHVAQVAYLLLTYINRNIGLHLGPDYMLGQYYIPALPANVDDAKQVLGSAWQFQILPQLIDLFHGRFEVLADLLDLEEGSNDAGLMVVAPTNSEEELGAAAYIVASQALPDVDKIFAYFARLLGTRASS